MHLPLGNHGRESQQQQDAREARRLFRESARSDWTYPPLPTEEPGNGDELSSVQQTIAGFKVHDGLAQTLADQLIPEIAEWHEREYGSSDSDVDTGGPNGSLASERAHAAAKAQFVFQDPDTVKQELADRRQIRHVRRQCLLAEELEWNEGLQLFLNRRDAWTGSKTQTAVKLHHAAAAARVASQTGSSATPSPRSSTSLTTCITTPSTSSTAMTSPDPASASIPILQKLPAEVLTPRMTRVLSAHPIRRKIGPSMYTEIYSKIILQSRTPAVPINLLNLTRALVAGWKTDGEWPPKPSVPEPSMGRRRTGLREGVRAAARVLKITSADTVVSNEDKKKKAG